MLRRCYKNVFYLVTLVYPRCAQTCLQLFSVTKLDVGSFLSADFTIIVRDTAGHWGKVYVRYLAPGIALMLVFAIGLPIWYFYIMWTVRTRLRVSNLGNRSSYHDGEILGHFSHGNIFRARALQHATKLDSGAL